MEDNILDLGLFKLCSNLHAFDQHSLSHLLYLKYMFITISYFVYASKFYSLCIDFFIKGYPRLNIKVTDCSIRIY